jgi:hypothetical protein
MKKQRIAILTLVLSALSAGTVNAAKVCLNHEDRYILINESAKQTYLNRGARETTPELCIEACVSHNGTPTVISFRFLPEHLTHETRSLNLPSA